MAIEERRIHISAHAIGTSKKCGETIETAATKQSWNHRQSTDFLLRYPEHSFATRRSS